MSGALSEVDWPIHIVCSGTDGRISLEDSYLAGALASHLRRAPGNDEAVMVTNLWRPHLLYETGATMQAELSGYSYILGGKPRDAHETWLAERISPGRGGQRVTAIGLAADLSDATRINRYSVVAELQRDPLRITQVG